MLTERLRLRPFTAEDLRPLHALWSHPDVGRWLGVAERVEEVSARTPAAAASSAGRR